MGVSNSMIWITWFCTIVIEMIIPLIISTILLSSWGVFSNKTLPRTDITLIFVVLLLYTTATISFCFLTSALFKKGKCENLGAYIPQAIEMEKKKLLKIFYNASFFFFEASNASTGASVFWVLSILPLSFAVQSYFPTGVAYKILSSLSHNTAMGVSFTIFFLGESQGTGKHKNPKKKR